MQNLIVEKSICWQGRLRKNLFSINITMFYACFLYTKRKKDYFRQRLLPDAFPLLWLELSVALLLSQ